MGYPYLIFTIPMVLSVIAGFAIVFVLLPHWLIRRYRLTPTRKMVAGFALAGLLIPLVFEAKYELTGTEILSQSVWLWPSSWGLMGLDRYSTTSEIIVGFGLATLSNIGLYAIVGWVAGVTRNRLVANRG